MFHIRSLVYFHNELPKWYPMTSIFRPSFCTISHLWSGLSGFLTLPSFAYIFLVNSLLRFTTSAVHEHVDHVSVIFGMDLSFTVASIPIIYHSWSIIYHGWTIVEPSLPYWFRWTQVSEAKSPASQPVCHRYGAFASRLRPGPVRTCLGHPWTPLGTVDDPNWDVVNGYGSMLEDFGGPNEVIQEAVWGRFQTWDSPARWCTSYLGSWCNKYWVKVKPPNISRAPHRLLKKTYNYPIIIPNNHPLLLKPQCFYSLHHVIP